MTIGTSLFHSLNARSLSKLGSEIASMQDQISSGKNDPRSSQDPVRALNLSAAKEQQQLLERFETNLDRVGARLDQADGVMGEVVNLAQRLGELSLRAASDSVTPSERETIAIEVKEIRRSMIDMSNARDDSGRPLFGGFLADGSPFVDTADGVKYVGDGGRHQLQVSESASLPTSLTGEQVFLSVPGQDGGDVFAMIDDFLSVLGAGGNDREASVTASGTMSLNMALTREPVEWSMQVTGPNGTQTVSFDIALGSESVAVDAINATSANTGITASLDPATGEILLSANGEMSIGDLSTRPEIKGTLIRTTDETGQSFAMVPEKLTPEAQISRLGAAAEHFADQRAKLGALGASAQTQADIIDNRKLVADKAVAGLEDLDLAATITRLQKSLLTRDATQQAYVKITQQSLFDFLR